MFFCYIFFILIVILDILKYKGKPFKINLKKLILIEKNVLHTLFIIINTDIYKV